MSRVLKEESAKWRRHRLHLPTTPPPLPRRARRPLLIHRPRPHPHTVRRTVSPHPEVRPPRVHAWYRRADATPLLPMLRPCRHTALRRALYIRRARRCRRCRGSCRCRHRNCRCSTQRQAWHTLHTPRPCTWHIPCRCNLPRTMRATMRSRGLLKRSTHWPAKSAI